jgi:hypothetical protein
VIAGKPAAQGDPSEGPLDDQATRLHGKAILAPVGFDDF